MISLIKNLTLLHCDDDDDDDNDGLFDVYDVCLRGPKLQLDSIQTFIIIVASYNYSGFRR